MNSQTHFCIFIFKISDIFCIVSLSKEASEIDFQLLSAEKYL